MATAVVRTREYMAMRPASVQIGDLLEVRSQKLQVTQVEAPFGMSATVCVHCQGPDGERRALSFGPFELLKVWR